LDGQQASQANENPRGRRRNAMQKSAKMPLLGACPGTTRAKAMSPYPRRTKRSLAKDGLEGMEEY